MTISSLLFENEAPAQSGVASSYDAQRGLTRSAEISQCGRYRYWLRRAKAHSGRNRSIAFIMLNPSTANALEDDPTIRRCMDFAWRWGFNVLSVFNLFALRSADPQALLKYGDPVGPRNDEWLLNAAVGAELVLCAWGDPASAMPTPSMKILFYGRVKRVKNILNGKPLHALNVTKYGQPGHPLYVRSTAQPIEFTIAEER